MSYFLLGLVLIISSYSYSDSDESGHCSLSNVELQAAQEQLVKYTDQLESLYYQIRYQPKSDTDQDTLYRVAAAMRMVFDHHFDQNTCLHFLDEDVLERAMIVCRRSRTISQAVYFSDRLDELQGKDGHCACTKCEKY